MERKNADSQGGRQLAERGASPLLGIVLLFAIVMIGATLVFVVGSSMFDAIQQQAYSEQNEQTMLEFDSELTTLGLQNDTKGTINFGKQTDNEIVTDGKLTVTVSDGYANETSKPIELRTLVMTDESGKELAYQAGGVWRRTDQGSSVVSAPNLRYYHETVDGQRRGRVGITPVTVEGNVGSGEHTVQQTGLQQFDSFGSNVEYVNYVTITVDDTSYHHGWYDFLKDEFNATDSDDVAADCNNPENAERNIICHEESEEQVTVVAAVDGETPLASLVGMQPTVYGGLYLEGTTDTFDSELTVTGYDDHTTGTNETADLFVANYETYDLKNHADIDGIPVVNGTLGSRGNPAISTIGYGTSVNPGPKGEPFEEDNAYWLDAHENALATELSSSYGDISEIDGKIDNIQTKYLDGKSAAGGTVDAGLYDGIDSSINTLDTSAGNVYVGVDSDLDLSNVDVRGGNRTSLYVDGDVDLSNVEIQPNDRADALWVYATSDSEVTIDGDFQGVVYAPGADIEIESGTTVDGAVVAGNDAGIEDNVQINFDRSLRTATVLSDDDQNLLFEYGDTRPPIDATFILDRSGSMGPHNLGRNTYTPTSEVRIDDDNWEPIPVSDPFRNDQSDRDIEVRNTTTGTIERVGYRETVDPENWHEIRVVDQHCYGIFGCFDHADLGLYDHPGNDPGGERAKATRDFIRLMNESNGDRAGVYDFNRNGHTLHELDGDLETAEKSVVGNAYGGTNMADGLEQALDDYGPNPSDDRQRVAVLLSDGKNSRESYNDDMDDLVDVANDRNVTLYTVGLTGPRNSSIPEDDLEEWATDTGGEYYRAENDEDLRELFVTIAEDEVKVDSDAQVEVAVTNKRPTSTSGYAISVSERTVLIDN
ncbi:VWA domain-containing protein [Natrinema sp. H-ect1]|uniref:DUF7289 family protein n=1 Tax=Natrinema sp. H-ect1 TaxID=3242700 RepID=UPI00359E14B4